MPNQCPRAALARVLRPPAFGIVVVCQAPIEVVRLADIEAPSRVLKDVYVEHTRPQMDKALPLTAGPRLPELDSNQQPSG